MKIEIQIEKGVKRQAGIEIRLIKETKVIDSLVFSEERKLSERLLSSIDDLLKKNKFQISDVSEVALISDVDESFTTYRIAQSVVNALNWAKKS